MIDYVVVYITVPTKECGEEIAEELVYKRLAACVNILPNLRSIYHWQGNIETGEELLLIVKTSLKLMDHLIDSVKKIHPYQVPEIIAMPIIHGNSDYLNWIKNEVIPT